MSPTKLSKPRKRRKFTPELKVEAVRLALAPGKTITEVARELDLTVTCLHDWVRQAGVDARRDPQGALTTDERAELTRLRRELRTIEQERDFQKNSYAAIAAQVETAAQLLARVRGAADGDANTKPASKTGRPRADGTARTSRCA